MRIELNECSFDILIGFNNPTEEELNSLFGEIELKLFAIEMIPFIVLKTPSFTVDMSINILKINNVFLLDWLEGNDNFVKIVVVDPKDMTLKGLRFIRISFMDKIREILKGQLSHSVSTIEQYICLVTSQVTTEQMEANAIISSVLRP